MTPIVATATAVDAPARERPNHIPALDGLRGLAILLVILHNSSHFPENVGGTMWLVALIATVGWIGVQLFFVLSGFLITGSLLDTQHSPNYLRVFFARRVLRIFPLYYAALLIGLVIAPLLFASHGISRPGADQVWLWTFLFNWAHPFGAASYGFPHFWSLAVEEQFYLLWPFILQHRPPTAVWKLCLWIAATALAIRIVLRSAGADPEVVYEITVCRIDALAIGAAVAAIVRVPAFAQRVRNFAPWILPTAILLALAGAVVTWAYTRNNFGTQTYGHSILALVFAAGLLAALVDRGWLNHSWQLLLSIAALRRVGKYSYGMYVVHFPIDMAMQSLLPKFRALFGTNYPIGYFLAVTALTFVAAFASYHVLEKHFLRLKRHFVPQSPALAQSGAAIKHA